MPTDPASRLMKLAGMQSESMRLLMEADRLKAQGNLAIAQAAYDRLIAAIKRQLAETERINADFPTGTPMDVIAVVNPLLDALGVQADLHETQGRRGEAERLRGESLDFARKYMAGSRIAEHQLKRADSFLTQGQFHEGLISLATARDLFAKKGQVEDMAKTAILLAEYYEWLGDWERALVEVERAHQFVADRLQVRTPAMAEIKAALASATRSSGTLSMDEVLSNLKRVEELVKLQQIRVSIIQVRARIGSRSDRFEESERLFDQVYPEIPDQAKPAIRWQIAAMRVREGRHREALAIIAELEPLFEAAILRHKLPVLLMSKAEALVGLERTGDALSVIECALADAERFDERDTQWKMRWVHATILNRLERRAEALQSILNSAAAVDEMRRAPLGWRLDSTFLKDKLPMFRDGIRLAAVAADAVACCQLIEKVKARALTAVLNLPAQGIAAVSTVSDTQRARVDNISMELDALDYRSNKEGWTEERQQRRQALLEERAALLEQLRIADPRWRALTAPVPLDLPRIQELLNTRKQAVLDLFFQPDRIVTVFLAGGGLSVDSTALSAKTLESIERYLANFSAPRFDARLFDPSAALGLAVEDLLPASLVEAALGAESLVVIPHGPLHLLPWAALTWRGQRLFELLPVSILPNLACLTALDGGFAASPRAAILGAPDYSQSGLTPLDGAREELRTVAEIYMDTTGLIGKPLTGATATEPAFWELARAPQPKGAILHLACHARFENEEPQHSALQLADGQVDVAEITAARMNFEEVILSGCNTGQRAMKVQGVELTGDDILGLPGAFLEAGVRSVLVSIPPASDSAAIRFMALYHEERSAGSTPLYALQKVQVTMLAEGLHPIDTWIGFTLYGAQ